MPGQTAFAPRKPYLKIIQGKIAMSANKGDQGATLRVYELPNGQKGEKWEVYFSSWEGVLEKVTFKDGDYGETCYIELDDAIIQMGTASKYFKDFACKIFNADLMKPIVIHPYDMEMDGRKMTGISLQQDGNKLKNYFYDGTSNLHGFPEVDREKAQRKSYWKIYFAEVTEFLVDKLQNFVVPAAAPLPETSKFEDQLSAAEDVFLSDPENDLPF